MKEKINLSKVNLLKFFYGYIYPAYAKEFLFMNNYQQYAEMIQLHFILTPEQWAAVLEEWELKEQILSDDKETGCPFDDPKCFNPAN